MHFAGRIFGAFVGGAAAAETNHRGQRCGRHDLIADACPEMWRPAVAPP